MKLVRHILEKLHARPKGYNACQPSRCVVIRPDDAARRQIADDFRNLRVFEEALSTDPDGNPVDGEIDPIRLISERFITAAKQAKLWIDPSELLNLGRAKMKRTSESLVFSDESRQIVIKVKDPFAKLNLKRHHFEWVIYEHLVHNLLFPNAAYKLIGFSIFDGRFRMILEQAFVKATKRPSANEVDDYLSQLGFRKDGYFHTDEWVSLTDTVGDNVLTGDDRNLYFIDPIIGFRRPPEEVMDHYLGSQMRLNNL